MHLHARGECPLLPHMVQVLWFVGGCGGGAAIRAGPVGRTMISPMLTVSGWVMAAVGLAVTFGFVQFEDLQAVQEPGELGPVLEGHAGVAGPAVAGAEQLSGEDPAGNQRAAYLLPRGRELRRRA